MSVCMLAYLSVCLSMCLSVCLSVSPHVCLVIAGGINLFRSMRAATTSANYIFPNDIVHLTVYIYLVGWVGGKSSARAEL